MVVSIDEKSGLQITQISQIIKSGIRTKASCRGRPTFQNCETRGIGAALLFRFEVS